MVDLGSTDIADVKLLRPARHGDSRGWLSELWAHASFAGAGLDHTFQQDNLAHSDKAATLRGLHFQRSPMAQGKLVAVLSGAIQDVAVDLRADSPTRGRHVSITLSAREGDSIWVPPGFAHGYCTLGDDTLVLYKLTAPYAPELEGGIAFDDPDLDIEWAYDSADLIMSDRDRHWPRLRDLDASP